MADGSGESSDPLLNFPIFQEINASIAQILNGICSRPKADVVDTLITEIDGDALLECRDILFSASVNEYQGQLEAKGITGKLKLELKQRRSDSSNGKTAQDIVDMVTFVCGLVKHFPRDILSARSTYIEIDAGPTNGSDILKRHTSSDCAKNKDRDETICMILDKVEKIERSLQKLWDYTMNIEKMHGDEITEIKKQLNGLMLGINGLNTGTANAHVSAMVATRNGEQGQQPRQTLNANQSRRVGNAGNFRETP